MTQTQAYIESKPNWIASYQVRNGTVWCLMATANGLGSYWEIPDYAGLFPWGATLTFCGVARDYTKVAAHA